MARFAVMVLLAFPCLPGPTLKATADEPATLAQLVADFKAYSGSALVFEPAELPPGRYHDRMPTLPEGRRLDAARIALREVRKLPAGYLGGVGLRSIGVFGACVSEHGDGFRPYDERLKGYRYYGIWNGKDACAVAYYTDDQLPLTMHHELFHHIDAAEGGRVLPDADLSHDERLREALAGRNPYPALSLSSEDLAALRQRGAGRTLQTTVSDYSAKNPAEDKAETARYLMNNLPDALVQMATRPELPGSQRLLHVLHKYRQALPDGGATTDWFSGVALGRRASGPRLEAPEERAPSRAGLAARLREFMAGGPVGPADGRDGEARALLRQVEGAADGGAADADGDPLLRLAADLTHRLLVDAIEPADRSRSFTVRGREDEHGVNWTLRRQVADLGEDGRRLGRMAALAPDESAPVARIQLQDLGLLAHYYRYIDRKWRVSDGTRSVFENARDDILASLPAEQAALARRLGGMDLDALADEITDAGAAAPAPDAERPLRAERPQPDNPYLAKVDAAINDPAVRAAIRKVQPACVALDRGSGVNIDPAGQILTAAHVAGRLHARVGVQFPDGSIYVGRCTAIDARLDLAILSLTADEPLPSAPVAREPPEVGTRVVCIGQPGATSPSGRPTGYQPFTVSRGAIRGFVGDPLGDQALGRTKHDAWTYWGHSGSPLFNEAGAIVALHNSWDSATSMRHAVTHQAIIQFLEDHTIPYHRADH